MPTNNPLVSIIIPTYNRAHLIGETLDSVFAQTYQDWECIVVDDGSTDDTAAVMMAYIAKDSRFQYHHRPKDRLPGGNAARNYGFEVSVGEYIQWFDSDDLMHPEKLIIQVNALEKSDFKFSVCNTLDFKETVSELVEVPEKILISENLIADFISYKIIILTPNLLIKKEFLSSFDKLFDEDLRAAQEWEFNFRLLYKARVYHVCDKTLSFIRKHSQNISSKNKNFLIVQYFIARIKIYKNPQIILNRGEKQLIQEFLQRYFKKIVRMRTVRNSFKAYLIFVIGENEYSLKTKIFAFVSILSFGIFNKGDVLLKNVFYNYEEK
ncbi:glycosyltransferase family 2 protein [Mesoflavibacter zeaxanthinifaciens]|uniref:glycosyltransferase family 2 protein n=1 Tax=Mesoflavibacter zeaxanthinifaciens TaxID=393060 RepID=UPI003A8EDFA5